MQNPHPALNTQQRVAEPEPVLRRCSVKSKRPCVDLSNESEAEDRPRKVPRVMSRRELRPGHSTPEAVISTDDEGVVDLSAKRRRRAKAASGDSATAELKARQKAKEARQSEEDAEEHADEKEGEDADEDEESEEEQQPPPKRQKKMVSCTECGLALKPSDKRYRTTRAHHACGLTCKKMQYALTQSGGAEAANGLNMFKTKKK